MLEGSGLASILEFGALGLLGTFLYLSYQVYKDNTKFTQELTQQMVDMGKEYADNNRNTIQQVEGLCKGIEDNRTMEKDEHQALMKQHETLMDDHKRITQKLTT